MIDDQVNAEELAESRQRRKSAENATDDGMPMPSEDNAQDAEVDGSSKPMKWVRYATKWFGAGSRFAGPLQR
ncbi:hypothetical protein AWB81_04844 [Caballeronia arationis]|jgi:hypothetical protein|uniref:Uncharacterized protein n=1 Tax=Caballeronia arationis TaxID=1777142 RepID=A0A7Z7N112_9BURK|nr:hypothetical protein [Caballeronia arationis]SAK90713.1 hypothetical protein AWB81_04844 [Caballeronia arationis]SOE55884.1 hypothetical protein SAMN05446927_1111 [Caballeronia arationis]